MSSTHRISLKTQWKIEQAGEANELNSHPIRTFRAFHRPTGLDSKQVVRFCFLTDCPDVRLLINDIQCPVRIIKGLATAIITGMMESINHLEIRWRVEHFEALSLSENFAAWLDISDETLVDP